MDLIKIGNFLRDLRKEKGMTQKQVADELGMLPKTVSKWETGHGFPDVSVVSSLADVLGVSERSLLFGDLTQNTKEVGNMKKIKFYVCPDCGSMMQGTGECDIVCCGKPVEALKSTQTNEEHSIKVSEIENDYYIEFNHEMRKDHFIEFVSYVGFDRVLTIRLYPEQASAVRLPKMFKGKLCFYCKKHGLFEYQIK